MRKLTTKEIVLLIALVFIVSGALYYNYFYRPFQDKMLDLDTQINTNNQRLLTLQNEQQSIVRDTEKLNNELLGVQDNLEDIPVGIDEPLMLVFIEETLSGLATESSYRFTPEIIQNEYFQTSQVAITFKTTYPNLKIILDGFALAPFRNRIVTLNASFKDQTLALGPTVLAASDPVAEIINEEETGDSTPIPGQENENYLSVEFLMDCFTITGSVEATEYPFMIGPYNNINPFEEMIEETEEVAE